MQQSDGTQQKADIMRVQCMWLWNEEAMRDRKSLHMQNACMKYEFLLELNRTTRCLGGQGKTGITLRG